MTAKAWESASELEWGCVPASVLVMARVSLLGQVWVLSSRSF